MPNFDKHITRRRLLQLGGSAAVVVGGGSVLAGCLGGDDDDGGSEATGATTTATDKVQRGGTVTVGLLGMGAAETLSPLDESGDANHARTTMLFDKLFTTDKDMAVVGALCSEAEPSSDAQTWTLTIRDGVTFHDGKSLTADDVVHTMKVWNDPATLANGATAGIIDFKGVRKVGPMQVEVPLVQPVGEFTSILTAPGTSIIPVGSTPKSLAAKPIGTGPFTFGSFTAGRSSTFPAYKDYWQEGKPYVDEVVVDSSFSDPTALMNALLAGQVNVYSGIPYLAASQQMEAGQVNILAVDAQYELPMYMRVDKGPFTDSRVRQALRLIADRQALVDGALAGLGTVGNDLLGRYDKYFAEDLTREQDIEQAKSLLKAAGREGETFVLQTSRVTPGFFESATLFAEQAKAAGITIQLDNVDPSTYFTGPGGYGTRTFGQSYYTALPSLTILYLAAFWADSPAKETWWGLQQPGGPDADKLLFEAIGTVDETQAQERWREVQELQFNEGGVISWGDGQNIIGTTNNVNGLEPGRNVFDNFKLESTWLSG